MQPRRPCTHDTPRSSTREPLGTLPLRVATCPPSLASSALRRPCWSQDARASRAVAVAQRAGLQPVVPEVLELYPDTWEAAIGQPRRTFVEFYAPWCPYCKRLEPIWAQLATDLSKTKSDVQIARLNADTYVDFMPRYDVQGFPTLVLFDNGRPVSTYQGRADLEPLTKFVS